MRLGRTAMAHWGEPAEKTAQEELEVCQCQR